MPAYLLLKLVSLGQVVHVQRLRLVQNVLLSTDDMRFNSIQHCLVLFEDSLTRHHCLLPIVSVFAQLYLQLGMVQILIALQLMLHVETLRFRKWQIDLENLLSVQVSWFFRRVFL